MLLSSMCQTFFYNLNDTEKCHYLCLIVSVPHLIQCIVMIDDSFIQFKYGIITENPLLLLNVTEGFHLNLFL